MENCVNISILNYWFIIECRHIDLTLLVKIWAEHYVSQYNFVEIEKKMNESFPLVYFNQLHGLNKTMLFANKMFWPNAEF